MLVYLDDAFELHQTGKHPECATRITNLNQTLRNSGLLDEATLPTWEHATLDAIRSVHTAEYAAQLQSQCAAGGGQIESDTFVCPDSWAVTLRAAGAAIDATQRVINGEDSIAFCAIRPPGHHALPTGPMGFCLFNNVAIAAQSAIASGLDRVLIVDWDVHHGNGTQDTFYESEQVAFFSIHRSPFYPGTGSRAETGTGKGLGTTVNVPVTADIGRVAFMREFERNLSDVASRCKPDLIFISAGFDAHRQDPVGSLCLEEPDFAELTRTVQDIAVAHCGGKIISLLEGGYHLNHMPQSALEHVRRLATV